MPMPFLWPTFFNSDYKMESERVTLREPIFSYVALCPNSVTFLDFTWFDLLRYVNEWKPNSKMNDGSTP